MTAALTPAHATRAVRQALTAAGLTEMVRTVTSRPAVAGTGLSRAVRTDVTLHPHQRPEPIAAVLAGLPDVVQTLTTATSVAVYRAERPPSTAAPQSRRERRRLRMQRLTACDQSPDLSTPDAAAGAATRKEGDTTMSEPQPPTPTLNRILAALAVLHTATAKDIATHAGLGYSTVTPKLRELDGQKLAERDGTRDGQALWRPTPAGILAAAVAAGQTAPADQPVDTPGGDAPVPDLQAPDVDTPGGQSTPDPASPHTEHPDDKGAEGVPVNEEPAAPEPAHVDEVPADQPAAEPATAPDTDSGDAATTPAAGDTDPDTTDTAEAVLEPTPQRRPAGSLGKSAVQFLRDHPGETFTAGQVAKAINLADADKGYAKASPGAVTNALTTAAGDGQIRHHIDGKRSTYEAA